MFLTIYKYAEEDWNNNNSEEDNGNNNETE